MEEGVKFRQKFETEKREKIMIWNRGEKVITRTEKGTSSKNSTLDVESDAEEARREEGGVSGNSLCDEIDRQEETEEEASY